MIKISAPMSVANVACGFDTLGFAIEQAGDEISVRFAEQDGLRITRITGDGGRLPLDVEKNTAGMAAFSFLQEIGESRGIEMEIHKKIGIGSGLGSSASSAVGGVFAVNELLGGIMERRELLPFAVKGESVASSAYHADNVAPCLLGGFVLVRDHASLDVVQIPTPSDLWAALVYPQVEVLTKDARAVMPKRIGMREGIRHWANVGALVAACFQEDYGLLGRSLEDVVAEPYRKQLIPHFDVAKSSAMEAGALGCSISGAGPTIFAFCQGKEKAQQVMEAMANIYQEQQVPYRAMVSVVNQEGVRRI